MSGSRSDLEAGSTWCIRPCANPDVGFIGCEPYINGVAMLWARSARRGHETLRFIPVTCATCLMCCPPKASPAPSCSIPIPGPRSATTAAVSSRQSIPCAAGTGHGARAQFSACCHRHSRLCAPDAGRGAAARIRLAGRTARRLARAMGRTGFRRGTSKRPCARGRSAALPDLPPRLSGEWRGGRGLGTPCRHAARGRLAATGPPSAPCLRRRACPEHVDALLKLVDRDEFVGLVRLLDRAGPADHGRHAVMVWKMPASVPKGTTSALPRAGEFHHDGAPRCDRRVRGPRPRR